MEDITAANGTVKGKIIYVDGNGPGKPTYIPFEMTIGDNCCEVHAQLFAMDLIRNGIEVKNNENKNFKNPEIARVEFD